MVGRTRIRSCEPRGGIKTFHLLLQPASQPEPESHSKAASKKFRTQAYFIFPTMKIVSLSFCSAEPAIREGRELGRDGGVKNGPLSLDRMLPPPERSHCAGLVSGFDFSYMLKSASPLLPAGAFLGHPS